MEAKPESPKLLQQVKTEYINKDDEDVDCFGNFSPKEVNTCLRCGLKSECEIVTTKLKEEKNLFRKNFKRSIKEAHKNLKESEKVVELVHKLKTKQKETEKLMKVKKKIKVKEAEESTKSEEGGKVVKLKKNKEGKAGRPKTREPVEEISGTRIPVTFKKLYKGVKELGTLKTKTSVTNVHGEHGILFCVPMVGRTSKKLELFINRSKGYKLEAGKYTEAKASKKGEWLLVVKADEKSQNEALEILGKWKKDQVKHLEAHGSKRGRKAGDSSEKKGKVVTKSKGDDEGGKKVKKLKKKGKVDGEKKSPIAAKPSDDDEEG